MITYLLPAILFVQFVVFAGVLLFCMHEWDYKDEEWNLFIHSICDGFVYSGRDICCGVFSVSNTTRGNCIEY